MAIESLSENSVQATPVESKQVATYRKSRLGLLTACRAWCCSDMGAMVLLGIVTALTFCRVLWADFLSYDDPFYVTGNSLVRSGLTWNSAARAWTTLECANWHPVTWMSLQLDYQLFGMRAWGFHLTNVLLHVANSLLVFTLLRRLTIDFGPALFIAAVFGVHPIHVESVAWITERKDVLATFFGLLAMLAYVRAVQTGSTLAWGMTSVWFLLSLASKPLLVTLPCLLLVLDYWPLKRWPKAVPTPKGVTHRFGQSGRMIGLPSEKWPLWILAVTSCIITVMAQQNGGAVATLERFGLAERLSNVTVSYCVYLQKTFWPTGLAVYYPYSMNRWTAGGVAAAVAVLLLVTGFAWRMRREHAAVWIGWLWFLGTLVPMIGLVQVGSQAMADRYLYFPLIGITWAATSAILAYWPQSVANRRLFTSVGCLLIASMSALTWHQSSVWQNDLTLSAHALQVTSNNYIAHDLYARALRTSGLPEQAICEYRRAIEIHPEYFSARNDLGTLLVHRRDFRAAIEQFRLGLESAPNHSRLRWNLANALALNEDFDAAEVEFKVAERGLAVSDAFALDHARALHKSGRFRSALDAYERAVALAPTSLVNQLELALALSRIPGNQGGDPYRAMKLLETLGTQTDAPRVWTALAEVQAAAGKSVAAANTWKRAIDRATALRRPDLADLARESQRRNSAEN